MTLPWPVLWLIDPAGAHMARRTPRIRGPIFSGAAVFGPDVPGGSRQATDEEIAAMDAASSDGGRRDAGSYDEIPPSQVQEAAQRLLHDGASSFRHDDRSIEARIIRFWRGDSLLEVATTAPGATSSSTTRIPRRPGADLIAGYLALELAGG